MIEFPKVFVSHASDDKKRFVLEFAERLRKNGVDAWLDAWEMLAGDSLIDKIFQEGLKDAKAVIVVLSKFSVTKNWVKEELNASLVKRINEGSQLIPIVLDECEVPEALKHIKWCSIKDTSSYEEEFQEILNAIFGTTSKPALGAPPTYITQSFTSSIGDLTSIDSLVLNTSCQHAVNKTKNLYIKTTDVFGSEENSIIPKEQLLDSLAILDEHGYIKLSKTVCCEFQAYKITDFGFEQYLRACDPSYTDATFKIVSLIINENIYSDSEIKNLSQVHPLIIENILKTLQKQRYLELTFFAGGNISIVKVSPTLKRAFGNQVVVA